MYTRAGDKKGKNQDYEYRKKKCQKVFETRKRYSLTITNVVVPLNTINNSLKRGVINFKPL